MAINWYNSRSRAHAQSFELGVFYWIWILRNIPRTATSLNFKRFVKTKNCRWCTGGGAGVKQRCAWTRFWIIWIRLRLIPTRQEHGFLSCSRTGWIWIMFLLKKHCWLSAWLIFTRTQTRVGLLESSWSRIRFGLDSASKFAKQDWIRTQKNQSTNTSSIKRKLARFLKAL